MRSILLLAFLASPAIAQTPPQELLKSREIAFECDKATQKCTLGVEDWAFMMQQNQLLGQLLNEMADQLQSCRFKGA